jgi:hypothetical protein
VVDEIRNNKKDNERNNEIDKKKRWTAPPLGFNGNIVGEDVHERLCTTLYE